MFNSLYQVGVFHDKEYFVKHGYAKALSFLLKHNLAGSPAQIYIDGSGSKYVLDEMVYSYFFKEIYTIEKGQELFPEVFI